MMNATLIEIDLKKYKQNHQESTMSTLATCQNRNDELAKTIEARLLGVHNFVATEAKYYVACRAKFENGVPKYSTSGRPTSTAKMTLFDAACQKLEGDIELCTVAEFHSMIQELGDEVYTSKITQIKLKENYENSFRLVETKLFYLLKLVKY